jgi:hypothetical protein
LKERLSVYPEFVRRDEFFDARVMSRVRLMADEEGYARTNLNQIEY